MNSALNYLEKHAAGEFHIKAAPAKGLKFVVVIPSYNETSLVESLVSLLSNHSISHPVEILIIVNWPEGESQANIDLNLDTIKSVKLWAAHNATEKINFHVIELGFIPGKKAGVGYARKAGMDEAVNRFLIAGQEDGVIISFDADTVCDTNYLESIEEHFKMNPSKDGCSIYFEHPLEGDHYSQSVYNAILQYELHMRCYLHAIRLTGFPNAFYTVGSAFAIKASSYCRQGGMNARQAGEDFYFLQKFFDLGNFSDLKKTRVLPSPRPSLRVPFGTGKAVVDMLISETPLKTYNPLIFEILKELFSRTGTFYNQISHSGKPDLKGLQTCLLEFLDEIEFTDKLLSIYHNSGSSETFIKRFYQYFNMFRILKFSKHARKTFPDIPVGQAAFTILQKRNEKTNKGMSDKELLLIFRQIDKS